MRALEREPSLRAELKRATATLHQQVESRLPLLAGDLTAGVYRRILECFLGFYAPHEAQLPAFGAALPFPLRDRSALLEADLRALGATSAELAAVPRCLPLPLTGREQVAGWLYVVEGASLGGQVVSRALARRLSLGRENGAAFFIGDGDGTAARWREVVGWLESLPLDGADGARVIAAASDTFARLNAWMESSLVR